MLLAAALLSAVAPFRDPRKPEAERLDDLMARLTVDDLLSALGGPGLPSLPHVNISGTTFALECLAGLTGVNVSTSWPMPISLGATFDTNLVRRIAAATADEVRGHHNAFGGFKQGHGGGLPPYAPGWGLLCLAPGLNLYRDPRWGRNYESFGEEPLVISRMGVASIQGFSGSDDQPRGRPLKTAAVAKHFAAYSLECIDPNTFPTCGYSRASFDAKVRVACPPHESRASSRCPCSLCAS
jgi:beta-glucosidase